MRRQIKEPVVFMKKHPNTIVTFLGVVYGDAIMFSIDVEMPRHRIELIFQNLSQVQ